MNVFVSKITFVIVLIVSIIFSLWLSYRMFFIIFPFIIAFLISSPMSKLTKWLHKKIPLPYGLLTFVLVILFVSLFITLLSFLAYEIAIALSGLSDSIGKIIQFIQEMTIKFSGFKIDLPWLETPIDINVVLLQSYDLILNAISQFANSLVDTLLSLLKTIPTIAFFFFFMFISLYFFTVDQDRIKDTLKRVNNYVKSPFLLLLKEKTLITFSNYIKAQLILVSITFTISLIALTIMKIPFSPLIAFAIAFVDLIPMVGPALIYIPWIVFALLISEYSTGIGLFVAYFVTTLTRQIIEPKIVSVRIGTHPLITIISMYTCYRVIGVMGFVLGAILVMISIIILNVYRELKQKDEHY